MKKSVLTDTRFSMFSLFFFLFVISFLGYQLIESSPLTKVKKGTHELFCTFYAEQGVEGQRKVNKELIVDFVDNTWLFTNGSAKNCQLNKAVNVL